jgi:hypothetical protein
MERSDRAWRDMHHRSSAASLDLDASDVCLDMNYPQDINLRTEKIINNTKQGN